MSRFKHDFEPHIETMLQRMVDFTEPVCQLIDASLAQMLTFDTPGIELYVTENNPKTLNTLIKKLKVYCKDKPDVDPHKMSSLKTHIPTLLSKRKQTLLTKINPSAMTLHLIPRIFMRFY